MNRNDIIEKLEDGICNITFTKVDGSTRDMVATLDEGIIGSVVEKNSSTIRQNVYDISLGAWRSFNWENLITVNGERVEV